MPPTFVVGAPRCGTTLVGLHLANARRFAFFPNAAKLHPRAPYLRTRLARRKGAYRPDYDSAYGKVEGPLAPSDGWDVLERFFPSYEEARAGAARARRGLAALVALFEELYGAPFLCKNNANSMRVEALQELFPRAFFVHVRRSYPEAAASLLEARARHRVPLGRWWSSAPPQLLERTFASEIEQVAGTLWGIDRYLEERLGALGAERALDLDYDAFCERPGELLGWIDERYERAGVRLERTPWEVPERFEPSRLPAVRRAELETQLAPVLEQLPNEVR